MINAVLVGFFNAIKLWPTVWVANTARVVGDVIRPTTFNAHTYVCTTAGTSHAATEPTWSTTNGGSTTDGTAVFKTFDMKTYNVIAPQGSTVPYVTFGLSTDVPQGVFGNLESWEDLTFWVNVFSSTSVNHVTTITDLVLAVLDDASLTVSGYTGMKCAREFMAGLLWDFETNVYQISLRYRVWIDKD